MAIVFFEERKKQQLLIPILIVVVTIAIAIYYFGVVREGGKQPLVALPEKKIEINLNVLENRLLPELELFQEIVPLDKEPGRENPFLPY